MYEVKWFSETMGDETPYRTLEGFLNEQLALGAKTIAVLMLDREPGARQWYKVILEKDSKSGSVEPQNTV